MPAMYVRIADDLRAKIKSGELAPGTQLKPEAGLQDEYSDRPEFSSNVSRNTVRDAIGLLAREGLVEKRPGQGTFVVEKIDPFLTTLSSDPEGGEGESAAYLSEVTRQGREAKNTPPRTEIQNSSAAPELLLGENEQVISRHQQRFIDGKPYSLQTSFYPMSDAEKAPRLLRAGEIEGGTVAYIQKSLGIKQVGWRDELHVRTANNTEIEFFDLPPASGAQVLETFRTAFDGDGHPIRLTVTVYPADRNRVAYEAGKVPAKPMPPIPPVDDGST